MKHKHYDLIIQWAADTSLIKQWKLAGVWLPCYCEGWRPEYEYRLVKPTVTRYNMHTGEPVEVPAPLSEHPKKGNKYWFEDDEISWHSDKGDKLLFERGIHSTAEDSEAYWEAILCKPDC